MAKATQSALLDTLLEQIKRKKTSPEMLSGAWHLATRHKNVDAMAIIAAADNLPDDVLAAVKSRSEIPVAVSYLTRSGLDIEERRARFQAEERAGVLAGCLESAALTDDDREIIGAKLVAKPTRALAEAVISEGQMPMSAVVTAVAQLDPRCDNLTEELRRNLRNQVIRLAKDETYAPQVAAVISNLDLANRFLCKQPSIDEASFNELFSRTIEKEIIRYCDPSMNGRYAYRIVSYLRGIIGTDCSYMNVPMVEALRRHMTAEDVAKMWTEVAGATKAAAETADSSGYSQKIIAASTSNDANVIETLIVEALSGENALLEPLTRNPMLTADQLRRIIDRIDERVVARALDHHQGDEDFAKLVYTYAFSYAVMIDNWKAFPDPTEGKRQVVAHFIAKWNEVGQVNYFSSHSRALSEVLGYVDDQSVYDLLPWGFVQEQIASYNADRYIGSVTRLQTEFLGVDQKKWETAEVLAADFSGTSRELFETAAML